MSDELLNPFEGTAAYEAGYADACETTDELLSTLMEDVRSYEHAYLRILRQYGDHMAECSRRRHPAAQPAPAAPGAGR